MPDIRVEVRGSWLGERRTAFLQAVHAAVVDAFRTPADEPVVRLVEHAEGDFLIPHAAGPRFTRIEIVQFPGRSPDAKRALYRAMVARLEPFDVPPHDVKVLVHEIDLVDVGFRGGQAACDVDLGYSLDV